MTQPTPFDPSYNFTDWQTSHPSDPLPADELDTQLQSIKTFSEQVCANLALIQRDDGALANDSVGIEQLSPEVDFGFTSIVDWSTGTQYVVRAGVYHEENVYRCLLAHTSDTFATDLANGKWQLVADFAQFVDAAHTYSDTAAARAIDAYNYSVDSFNSSVDSYNYSVDAASAAATIGGFDLSGTQAANDTLLWDTGVSKYVRKTINQLKTALGCAPLASPEFTGSVGIGTAGAVTAKLDVLNPGANVCDLKMRNGLNTVALYVSAAGEAILNSVGSFALSFLTGNIERMRIESTGEVIFKETAGVSVATGEAVLSATNTGTGSAWATLTPGSAGVAYVHNPTARNTVLTQNGADALTLGSGAMVGAPTGGLKGAGTINATGIYLNGTALLGQKEYLSTAQLLTAGTTLTLAHGLGVEPRTITFVIECTTADAGYAIGDRIAVDLKFFGSASTDGNAAALVDATNITVIIATSFGIIVPNKSTRVTTALTNASWRLYVKAYA